MEFLQAQWNAPDNVRAFSTTRSGGVSVSPFDSLNLGAHVNDDPAKVAENRQILQAAAHLPQAPLYLNQTHSTRVIQLPYSGTDLDADAVYTDQPNQVCLVMTADCLPVLFASKDGKEVAAAHAGWRGLCDGILENTVATFRCSPSEICAWLAPAISAKAFQVGGEVVEQFCAFDPKALTAFNPDPIESGKFYGDLYQIARQRLTRLGLTEISGGQHCTFSEADKFFSYRRDQVTGRMANLIWIEEN